MFLLARNDYCLDDIMGGLLKIDMAPDYNQLNDHVD